MKVPFLRDAVMAKALVRHGLKLELTQRALQVALSHFRDDAEHFVDRFGCWIVTLLARQP